eukprot:1139092-Pelagomonas_calceolata.AAC.3
MFRNYKVSAFYKLDIPLLVVAVIQSVCGYSMTDTPSSSAVGAPCTKPLQGLFTLPPVGGQAENSSCDPCMPSNSLGLERKCFCTNLRRQGHGQGSKGRVRASEFGCLGGERSREGPMNQRSID